jgi:hypothetical protein
VADNDDEEILAATVANWRNFTGRPATIIASGGDYLAPSLGDLTYDREANRRLERQTARRNQIWMAQARKQAEVDKRFRERPDPATAFAIAIEANELRAKAEEEGRKFRATKVQMDAFRWALYDIVAMHQPMTVRQTFYQATVQGIVPKTEAGYKYQVCPALTDLRKDGVMPYGWLVDNTRRTIQARTFGSMEDALTETAKFFRRSLWREAPVYVEVWIEKDALAGVVEDVTLDYDVPLMVSRGYSSLSFLSDAAEVIAEEGKPCFIYHLGDHDPSGVEAGQKIEETLRELAPFADIRFKRLAVTEEQIEALDLPSRPTKDSDPRTKNWDGGDSVELDAIEPDELRNIVRAAIERHVDQDQLQFLREQEEREKGILTMFAQQHRSAT